MKRPLLSLGLLALLGPSLVLGGAPAPAAEVRSLSPSLPDSSDPAVQKYRNRQDQATPQAVLNWLKAGNQRFASGKSIHGGFPMDARPRQLVAATGQRPLAVVLSCIDSRTAPELVFDVAVGDLFTARVGANVVNEDVLGSIEIASDSGARVVVVLGHTDCGGVKGACTNIEFGHFTQLADRVKPAISRANAHLDADGELAAFVGERVVTNRRYVAEVSHENARQSAEQLLARSEILRGKVAGGEIILIAALYDVDTGSVTFDAIDASPKH